MTLTTTQDQTLLDTLMTLIKRKQAHDKEWRDLDKLYSIYRKELREMEWLMHKTADGTIVIVSNMDDDHLFNTIKLILNRNHWDFSSIPDKYLQEAKRRPWMLDRILTINSVIEPEDEEEWEWV